jgi:hypothetical protein
MCEEIVRSRMLLALSETSNSKGVSLPSQLNKFKEKQDKLPWLKRVTGSNLTENELDKIFVKLETIWSILFVEENRNLEKYHRHQQTKNNQRETSAKLLSKLELENTDVFTLFKYLNRDLHLQLDKVQIMSILLKFIDDDDARSEEEQEDVDEVLLWLIGEYIRLSSLPSLNESETKRMLSILELAQIDNQLDEWISRIDTALIEKLEFPEQVCILNLEALDFKEISKNSRDIINS